MNNLLENRNELDCKVSNKTINKEKSLDSVEILIIKERNSDVIIIKRQKTFDLFIKIMSNPIF